MKDHHLFLDIRYTAFNHDEEEPDMIIDYDLVDNLYVDIMLRTWRGLEDDDAEIESEDAKIGFLELHHYNVSQAMNRGFNIYDTFDRSIDTFEMGTTIIDPKTGMVLDSIAAQLGDTFHFNILVIQRMGIYPQWRGKGYGKEMIDFLKKSYAGKAGYIFLKCFPWQCEFATKKDPSKLVDDMQLILFEQDYKKAQAKLKKYYKSCGFVALKENKDYFGYNLE